VASAHLRRRRLYSCVTGQGRRPCRSAVGRGGQSGGQIGPCQISPAEPSRIPSPEAIEAAIDLDDAEIVQRPAAVYDCAKELLQERLARRRRFRRKSTGDDGSET